MIHLNENTIKGRQNMARTYRARAKKTAAPKTRDDGLYIFLREG